MKNLKTNIHVPKRKNQIKEVDAKTKEILKGRYNVEHVFQRIKTCKRISNRQDKKSSVFESFIYLALIVKFIETKKPEEMTEEDIKLREKINASNKKKNEARKIKRQIEANNGKNWRGNNKKTKRQIKKENKENKKLEKQLKEKSKKEEKLKKKQIKQFIKMAQDNKSKLLIIHNSISNASDNGEKLTNTNNNKINPLKIRGRPRKNIKNALPITDNNSLTKVNIKLLKNQKYTNPKKLQS